MNNTSKLLKSVRIFSVLLLLPSFSSYAASELIGHWPFDGNANDLVGNANGVINGASNAVGKINQALSFDGSNDMVPAIPIAD